MRQPNSGRRITRDQYDAVLFDLDGVITDTASIHAACWKQMFDEYLQKRATERGEAFRPFDPVGPPAPCLASPASMAFATSQIMRYTTSRGKSARPAGTETVGGLGTQDHLVTRAIEEKGVEAYEGSVRFIGQLRRHGLKVAVVSSSENCEAVLRSAKVDGLFEVRVDGAMVEAQHLAGKPAPDTFLIAARLLGVEPARAVVVEDALSGIEAGLAGNFGLVVGVARRGNAEELRRHGAHLVVNDLGELVN